MLKKFYANTIAVPKIFCVRLDSSVIVNKLSQLFHNVFINLINYELIHIFRKQTQIKEFPAECSVAVLANTKEINQDSSLLKASFIKV